MKMMFLCALFFVALCTVQAESSGQPSPVKNRNSIPVVYHRPEFGHSLYIIERKIEDASNVSDAEIQEIAACSNEAIAKLDGQVRWIHSYVTKDIVYCVFSAASKEAILKHGKLGDFPVDAIREIDFVDDPTSAEIKSD